MRLQLIRPLRALSGLLFAATFSTAAVARGQSAGEAAGVAQVDTAHTIFVESPTRTHMFVYTPGVTAAATPVPWATVRAGYEADVVSGASVAVKAGPAYRAVNSGVDVVTTASVHDLRHSPHGGFTLRKDDVSVNAEYTYSTENDYRSHSLFVAARTDAYEHNTQFELSYARNFDRVCDRVQSVNDTAVRFRALEDSSHCFASDPLRTTRALAIDAFQATWTQAWTPIFTTQAAYAVQLVDGFQSNPYRSVVLGQGLKAQEHHPNERARQSVTLRANLFVRSLKLAVRLSGRIYRDTWDVRSASGELELERYVFENLRLAARGRYYLQSGALFWSDDYTGGAPPLGPKGQYWTGDRELSPFWNVAAGLRVTYGLAAGRARIAGVFERLKLGASGDVVQFDYTDYTLGGVPISNARAYVLGLNLGAAF